MISLHDLPIELLEHIFLNMNRQTRLRCKLVSKKWLELLMTRNIFSDDRHIFLTSCVIKLDKIPASIFMNSLYVYDKVTINNCEIEYKKFDELKLFWDHLGKSVTELSFSELNFQSVLIIKLMPKVQVLKFYETNLEILIHSLKILKRLMPNLQEIHPGMITSIDENLLRQLPTIVKDMKMVFKSHQKTIISDDDLQNVSIDSLIYYTEDDFQFLSQVIKAKGCGIRKIKLWSSVIPKTSFVQITDLTFELKNMYAIKFLKSIEKSIPNLKSLFMICKYEGCCFIHELVQPLKVENFKIFAQHCQCSVCFSFINNSFPNLKNVHVDFRVRDELKLLTFQAHIRKTMAIIESGGTQFITQENTRLLLSSMRERPHMKTVNLRYFCLVTPEDVDQMYRISPNLVGLTISFNIHNTTLDALVLTILTKYKSMEQLHVHAEKNNKKVCRKQGLAAVEHIVKQGGSLRNLHLPAFKDLADEYIMEILFGNLKQLYKFRNISRYEFMEDFYYKGYTLEDSFIGSLLNSH